jgi:hypothetical protein
MMDDRHALGVTRTRDEERIEGRWKKRGTMKEMMEETAKHELKLFILEKELILHA